MSSTSLILVRDSSPLPVVFVHNAGRGGLRKQTLLTCISSVQAASFVQQAWRWGSVCNWWLLILDAAFDSSSSISLADVSAFNRPHSAQPLGNAAPPSSYISGRQPFPSICIRTLHVDSLIRTWLRLFDVLRLPRPRVFDDLVPYLWVFPTVFHPG